MAFGAFIQSFLGMKSNNDTLLVILQYRRMQPCPAAWVLVENDTY
jgi:hypothetical protein